MRDTEWALIQLIKKEAAATCEGFAENDSCNCMSCEARALRLRAISADGERLTAVFLQSCKECPMSEVESCRQGCDEWRHVWRCSEATLCGNKQIAVTDSLHDALPPIPDWCPLQRLVHYSP